MRRGRSPIHDLQMVGVAVLLHLDVSPVHIIAELVGLGVKAVKLQGQAEVVQALVRVL